MAEDALPAAIPVEQTEAQRKLHDLLASMWEQRKSVVIGWMLTLEHSTAALAATGSDQSRTAGADAAHKMAGILGTFGLPRGTELAREAEVLLEQPGPVDAEGLKRLSQLTEELGLLIHQRSLPSNR